MTEQNKKFISISDDFSKYPIGRDDSDGKFNGERFRKDVLVPALNSFAIVSIDLDGPKGYGSSFLEEGFGGLIRKEGFEKNRLKEKLEITYSDPVYKIYKDQIWEFINEA